MSRWGSWMGSGSAPSKGQVARPRGIREVRGVPGRARVVWCSCVAGVEESVA